MKNAMRPRRFGVGSSTSSGAAVPNRAAAAVVTAAAAAIAVVTATAGLAPAAVTLVDQTRTLAANATGGTVRPSPAMATGTYGMFTNDSPVPEGTQSIQSDSTAAGGPYANTLAASKTGTINDYGGPVAINATSSAAQTSNVDPSQLAAAASVTGSASFPPSMIGGPTDSVGFADAFGRSTYAVDFTVDVPTPFSVTGKVTGLSSYHLGFLERVESDVTLSVMGQSTPLYTAGEDYTATKYGLYTDTVSFATVLQPGQTYELTANAYAESPRQGIGSGSIAPASAGFSFTTVVPEPASVMTLGAIASSTCLGRRRRATVRSR